MPRTVEIPEPLALQLAQLRALAKAASWYQAPADDAPALRLAAVEALERELEITLPDPVLAYLAAGVSAWGDGPLRLESIRERTTAVREQALEASRSRARRLERVVVIDDDSNGNYIGGAKGTPKPSDELLFLDHEEGFAPRAKVSLAETLERFADRFGPAEPFVPVLSDEPEPAPPVTRVRHAKFGAGRLVADEGENVLVAFDTAGEKRLKRAFVTFE